jgi:hypothetical protein
MDSHTTCQLSCSNQEEGIWQEDLEQEGMEDHHLGHHHAIVHVSHPPLVLFAAFVSLPLLLFALPEFVNKR